MRWRLSRRLAGSSWRIALGALAVTLLVYILLAGVATIHKQGSLFLVVDGGSCSAGNYMPNKLATAKDTNRRMDVSTFSDTDQSRTIRAFVPGQPKFFHLLSYQRSGSSVVGDLFQNMSRVFYVYEPLDGLYTAMYGTRPGYNVPSDIFIDLDGKLRKPPPAELKMTVQTLDAFFNCRISTLPFPLLIHPFWRKFMFHMPKVKPFVQCASRKEPMLFSVLGRCNKLHLRHFCGSRFNLMRTNAHACFVILYNDGEWNSSKEFIQETLHAQNPTLGQEKLTQTASGFLKYFSCIGIHRKVVRDCAANYLDTACREHPIRAVKTVRGLAEASRSLAEKYANFRLIHLLRDPRGAAKSRYLHGWSRGIYEKKDPGKIAGSYCAIGKENDIKRAEIEVPFPGKTLRVVFDAFAKSPRECVRNVLTFIGENVTESSALWVKKMEQSKISHMNITREDQWKVFFSYHDVQRMTHNCHDFFESIPFNWTGILLEKH